MSYYKISGNEYDEVIPDTLDLVERAELSIRGLANSIDPVLNSIYLGSHVCCREPHMFHHASGDTTCDPKFAESFPMMRIMSGSTCETEKEHLFDRELLSRIDSGLYWDRYSPERPWRNNYGNYFYGQGKNEDFSVGAANGRMLRALIVLYEITNDSIFEKNIYEFIDSLKRIAIYRNNYCYYPDKGGWGEPCSYPRSGWINDGEASKEVEGAEGSIVAYHGHQAYAAANWYMLSGHKESLELAACLSRYIMLPKFWGGVPNLPGRLSNQDKNNFDWYGNPAPDPPNTAGPELGHWFGHFHARSIGLRGVLAYGTAAADDKAIEFVRRSYEFSLTQGIPRIGSDCPKTNPKPASN
ncbi:MAG: hypothetical protein Q7J78_03595 [Clostridiales bacterium]|nr:hypothetical protein [Clostridiales bacterium]